MTPTGNETDMQQRLLDGPKLTHNASSPWNPSQWPLWRKMNAYSRPRRDRYHLMIKGVAAGRRLTNSMALCLDLADQLWVTAMGYLLAIERMGDGQSKTGTGGQFVAGDNNSYMPILLKNCRL